MPRPKSIKIDPPLDLSIDEVIEDSTIKTVELGGRKFEIHPISDRSDSFAYDDSAEFLMLAIPVGSRVFNEMLKLGAENNESISRLSKVDLSDDKSINSASMDLVDIITKSNIENLLRDVSSALPKLAAIACHYTDQDVTEDDVKSWAKSPLNSELWKAVIWQMKADNIIAQITNLKGLMSEFSAA